VLRATTQASVPRPDPAPASSQPHAPASAEVLPLLAATGPLNRDAADPETAQDIEAGSLPDSRGRATGSAGTADSTAGSPAAPELVRSPAVAAPEVEQGHAGQRPKARSAFAAAMAGGGKRKSGQVRAGTSVWRLLATTTTDGRTLFA